MTTVFDITLAVALKVTDVLEGTATAGATTSLTDTVNLIQNNQYWDKGTLWIRTGTHANKVLAITGYLASKFTFASLGATAIAVGNEYSVIRGHYPYQQITSAIRQALNETYVESENETLVGDGTTLEFTLPNGVSNIKRVEIEYPDSGGYQPPSHHWREVGGKLRFDFGYAPYDDNIIHVFYRDAHPALSSYSTAISNEINTDWLEWKSAEKLLLWGAAMYGKKPEFLIEEKLNIVLENLKGKKPRLNGFDILIHTAGG